MQNLNLKDQQRMEQIAKILSEIKSDKQKDELVGAAKWAMVCNKQGA